MSSFYGVQSDRSKDAILRSIAALAERLEKVENTLKYEVQPNQKIVLYTGKSGPISSPYGIQYGEITHDLSLVDAVQALAKDQGLEFTYIPGTPARVELKEKKAQVIQS